MKERAQQGRWTIVLVDESGFYFRPAVVKTYGPQGQTPVPDEWQIHGHLSLMGGMTPQGQVYSRVRPKSLNGLHRIEFLIHPGRRAGDRLLVIGDGSPIHRRAEVEASLAEAGDTIHLEPLPPYAPDLNPVEWLWRHLKEVEMRDLTCLDPEQWHLESPLAHGRVRQRPHLFRSSFAGAGLEV